MKALLKYCNLFILLTALSCGGPTGKKEGGGEAGETDRTSVTAPEQVKSVILFFGNSLTAGMGLDPEDAFPSFIQQTIDSLGLGYTVVNAGLSGETTASGVNRLPWVLNQDVGIFILELGANDGLRGIPLEETRTNLQAMIDKVREENPGTSVILAGMQIPPNMGQAYTSEFRNIFPELAEQNETALIPFLLKDVGGIPELNQEDGIHPTREGHKIIAGNIWPVIREVIHQRDSLRNVVTASQ